MTAITFPNSPSSGDTHTAGNGIVYTYDGEKWTSIGTNSAGTWTRSGTEVSLTNAGDDLNVDSGTLFVDASTDRVGVGTSSPGSKLQIVSTSAQDQLRFGYSTSVYTDCWMGTGFTVIDSIGGTGGAFDFRDDGTSRMFIDSSGNVGIGTTTFDSPASGRQILEINGTSTTLVNLDTGGTRRAYWFTDGTDTYLYNTQAGSLIFGSNNSERARIDSSGRLLVGTSSTFGSSSGDLLQVSHTFGGRLLLQRDKTNITTDEEIGSVTWYSNAGNVQPGGRISCVAESAHASDDKPSRLVFSTTQQGYSTPIEAMRINRHGQLLVTQGANPAFTGTNARIYARGSAPLLVAEGNSQGYTEGAFMSVAPEGSRGGGIYMFNSNGAGTNNEWFAGRPYGSSDIYLICRATGVSIPGSTTAQFAYKLFQLDVSGNLTINGTLTQSASDDRLKANRTALTSALTKVESLEGFTYNWNQDAIDNYGFSADDGTLVGMSAQELQLVLPEAVKTVTHATSVDDPTSGEAGEEDTYLTIQYERVVPLLVEAIKELSSNNKALQARIEVLEAQ